uniref:Uncharacterized protein n=1 Tax=Timema tahoe TaxID=61484 RepID=A0A7R9NZ68_9NEOP|nr:unnamed protein product [Timema tahoe]
MSDSEEDLELFLLLDSNYCLFEENTRTWTRDFNEDRSENAIKEDLETHSNFRDCVSPEEKLTITIRLNIEQIVRKHMLWRFKNRDCLIRQQCALRNVSVVVSLYTLIPQTWFIANKFNEKISIDFTVERHYSLSETTEQTAGWKQTTSSAYHSDTPRHDTPLEALMIRRYQNCRRCGGGTAPRGAVSRVDQGVSSLSCTLGIIMPLVCTRLATIEKLPEDGGDSYSRDVGLRKLHSLHRYTNYCQPYKASGRLELREVLAFQMLGLLFFLTFGPACSCAVVHTGTMGLLAHAQWCTLGQWACLLMRSGAHWDNGPACSCAVLHAGTMGLLAHAQCCTLGQWACLFMRSAAHWDNGPASSCAVLHTGTMGLLAHAQWCTLGQWASLLMRSGAHWDNGPACSCAVLHAGTMGLLAHAQCCTLGPWACLLMRSGAHWDNGPACSCAVLHTGTMGLLAHEHSSMASLVLTDSSQLTSDSQHLGIYLGYIIWSGNFSKPSTVSCELSVSTKEAMGLLYLLRRQLSVSTKEAMGLL